MLPGRGSPVICRRVATRLPWLLPSRMQVGPCRDTGGSKDHDAPPALIDETPSELHLWVVGRQAGQRSSGQGIEACAWKRCLRHGGGYSSKGERGSVEGITKKGQPVKGGGPTEEVGAAKELHGGDADAPPGRVAGGT